MKLLQCVKDMEYELVQGSADEDYTALVYDSRKVCEGCIFICMAGSRFDSHNCIDDIVKAGAKAVIIERECEIEADISVIRVDSSRRALALCSAAWFSHPANDLITIGITGTKGKTTSTHMLKTMLEKNGKKVGVIGTNGVHIGDKIIPTINTTPESYELHAYLRQMVNEGCEYLIMEVSSQGIKMHRTAGIVYDYAVFTNISPDHIGKDEHADFEEYLYYKRILFSQAKVALVNLSDQYSDYIISHSESERLYTFGEDEHADYRISKIEYLLKSDFMGIHLGIRGKLSLDADVGIPGKFNAYNATVAFALGDLIGLSIEQMRTSLSKLYVDGRMELTYVSDKVKVIVDYAHNAVSMESLLDTLREYSPKRLVVVFGCGGNRSKDRRYSMGDIAGRKADFSIITADNSRYEKPEDIIADIIAHIKGDNYIKVPDRREAIYYAIEHAKDGDIIAIIGKGHEDYQEIEGKRYHFLDREVVDEAVKKCGSCFLT